MERDCLATAHSILVFWSPRPPASLACSSSRACNPYFRAAVSSFDMRSTMTSINISQTRSVHWSHVVDNAVQSVYQYITLICLCCNNVWHSRCLEQHRIPSQPHSSSNLSTGLPLDSLSNPPRAQYNGGGLTAAAAAAAATTAAAQHRATSHWLVGTGGTPLFCVLSCLEWICEKNRDFK